MKLSRVLLAGACLAASCSAIDREAFTFIQYDLNVRVEPEQKRLGARGHIILRNDSGAPQRVAVVQVSSSLDWRSLRAQGKPLQFVSQPYVSDIDHTGSLSEAIVTLPDSIAPHATVDLEVGYEGTIPLDTTRLKGIGVPEDQARHTDWDQISPAFSAVRGVGYVTWYPVAMDSGNLSDSSVFERLAGWKNRESHAQMHVNICTTSGILLMNGRPVTGPAENLSASTASDGTNCSEHAFIPLGFAVPSFTVGQFEHLAKGGLDIYYLAGHRAGAENYSALIDKIAPVLGLWLGQPRSRASIIDLPDAAAAPFESGTSLLTPFSSDSGVAELTLAHQMAHAMFVSPRPWIAEGVAHFAQALWREHQSGRRAALDYMGLRRTTLADAEKFIPGQKQDGDDHSLLRSADDDFYRSKAMFVWWMLRDMLGDAALRQIFSLYDPSKDATQSYLQDLVQAQSGRNFSWFFSDWIYQDRGLPDFRIVSAYPRALDSSIHMTTVTVDNLGNAGAEVPVTAILQDGEVTKRLTVPGKGSASIRIETPSAPIEIVVNDGSVPESETGNNRFSLRTK